VVVVVVVVVMLASQGHASTYNISFYYYLTFFARLKVVFFGRVGEFDSLVNYLLMANFLFRIKEMTTREYANRRRPPASQSRTCKYTHTRNIYITHKLGALICFHCVHADIDFPRN
jgi:hypothetical protein